ncbi:UDP-4-amino-4,6-dideoxy-N-acetyl-beta-L-altrosamine transaminase [compost metagenome]
MIVTNNIEFYRKLLQFRNHGMTREPDELTQNDGPWYYEMQALGYNYRMTDMQAALGISQMDKLDYFVARRREIADIYNEELSNMEGLILPYQLEGTQSSWHLYVTRWEANYFDRSEVFQALRNENIGVNVHYIPVYNQPYYKQLPYSFEPCTHAENYYRTAITIPLFPKMTDDDVSSVIAAVKSVYRRYKGKK